MLIRSFLHLKIMFSNTNNTYGQQNVRNREPYRLVMMIDIVRGDKTDQVLDENRLLVYVGIMIIILETNPVFENE